MRVLPQYLGVYVIHDRSGIVDDHAQRDYGRQSLLLRWMPPIAQFNVGYQYANIKAQQRFYVQRLFKFQLS